MFNCIKKLVSSSYNLHSLCIMSCVLKNQQNMYHCRENTLWYLTPLTVPPTLTALYQLVPYLVSTEKKHQGPHARLMLSYLVTSWLVLATPSMEVPV